MMRRALFLVISVLSLSLPVHASGPAATPPMGWNSWNHFAARVSDKDVRAAADAVVSSGMREVGYVYINIDDGWQGTRDIDGVIRPNDKFPDMKALADYVHSKGLKLGIYSSPGPKTCAGYEGSYGHEEQDANTYAAWGVDYLKYDLCSYRKIMKERSDGRPDAEFALMQQAYEKMHRALLATGRPIVYSLCQYGWDAVWQWGAQMGGNLWRTTEDIRDTYDRMSLIGFQQAGLSRFARPGHWNDPDMLEIGNGGMNPDEYRTQMSLWAILSAPLLAGNDLSQMNVETRSILLNRNVIAVDQDALGIQGDRVSTQGPLEIWSKPLQNGAAALGLFNRGESLMTVTLKFSEVGFTGQVKLRDLWAGKDMGNFLGSYKALVPPHGVVMLVLNK